MSTKERKILIAFFSRMGNNYVNGRVVNLAVGNTEVIANMINVKTNGDMFRIDTVKPYPEDYDETTEVAKKELKSNARPQLSPHITDINAYNVIFLGYPNWWGTMPMPVWSFLESCDFSGKTIIPFCTHEGSGLGRSVKDIEKLCPTAEIRNPISFRGGSVNNSKGDVEKWIEKC